MFKCVYKRIAKYFNVILQMKSLQKVPELSLLCYYYIDKNLDPLHTITL